MTSRELRGEPGVAEGEPDAGLPGKVWLVGAGPGAADLLTLRAARLLAEADVILHDALIGPDVLALASPDAILIPVGKRCGRLSTGQRFINKRLIDAALRHRVVVRLKGGDPMLFGRAQEEIDALVAAGIRCEVVPGISAAFAASATLQRSLTRRGESRNVAFLTPRFGDGEAAHDWAKPAAAADTVVLYMASREPGQISAGLVAAGVSPDRPAVIIESASLVGERWLPTRVGDLATAAGDLGDGPALLLVGDVFAAIEAAGADGASEATGADGLDRADRAGDADGAARARAGAAGIAGTAATVADRIGAVEGGHAAERAGRAAA